jgi:hypothetical protein
MGTQRVGNDLVGRDPPIAGLGHHACGDVVGDLHMEIGRRCESTVVRLPASLSPSIPV